MKKRSIFKFSKNIIIDKQGFNELVSILQDYCDYVNYYIVTKNDDKIEFDNKEELLEYDNYKDGRIKNLELLGYKKREKNFCLNMYGKRHTPPYIECDYSFRDIDQETCFVKRLKIFFNKNVEGYCFHLTLSILIAIILVISSIYYLCIKYVSTSTEIMWAAAFWVIFIYYLIENKLLKYFFPPITFAWGEEIKRYKKRSELKKNIFWCVIVALFVTWLAPILF